MPLIRASERFQQFIDDICKKHKFKNREQATDFILDRLQYLEDLALEQTRKQAQQPSGMDKELGFAPTQTDLEYAESHKCPYRTMLDNNQILCAENKKIPLKACVTRQKRYTQFNRKCRPVGMQPKKQTWKKRADNSRTPRDSNVDWGDSDGYDSFRRGNDDGFQG